MEGQVETYAGVTVQRRSMPRALLAHPFITLLVAGVLVGGGLRFVPAGHAAAGGAGGTACAAK